MENLEVKRFIKKLQTTKFSVGVIGLGYVGLPICARFVKANIKVYGLDNDKKIQLLKKGISYIKATILKTLIILNIIKTMLVLITKFK